MSAPAEVVVGNDSVSVRPTGISKALMLETILKRICFDGDEDRSSLWRNSDAFVICISDLMMRDEEVFQRVQKIFETDDKDKKKSPPATSSTPFGLFDGERGGMFDGDVHSRFDQDFNLDANSKSLNDVYGRLNMGRNHDDSPDGPFGLQSSNFFGLQNMHSITSERDGADGDDEPMGMQKSPSEPDLAGLTTSDQFSTQLPDSHEDDASNEDVSLFTCTVNRKATRAGYHLSDTNDVAFLIAKFARELRRLGEDS